ncbi:hypothetical protein DID75_03065 [Candidatus Marinamargulisbacteria bacterium SCGC AG-410-N11]|nr:hypothetical protein DID75_03065 [Candidatus Marinamargulisbacteria bacterium SCGC AG-410-N11]
MITLGKENFIFEKYSVPLKINQLIEQKTGSINQDINNYIKIINELTSFTLETLERNYNDINQEIVKQEKFLKPKTKPSKALICLYKQRSKLKKNIQYKKNVNDLESKLVQKRAVLKEFNEKIKTILDQLSLLYKKFQSLKYNPDKVIRDLIINKSDKVLILPRSGGFIHDSQSIPEAELLLSLDKRLSFDRQFWDEDTKQMRSLFVGVLDLFQAEFDVISDQYLSYCYNFLLSNSQLISNLIKGSNGIVVTGDAYPNSNQLKGFADDASINRLIKQVSSKNNIFKRYKDQIQNIVPTQKKDIIRLRHLFEQTIIKKAFDYGIPILGYCAGSWRVSKALDDSVDIVPFTNKKDLMDNTVGITEISPSIVQFEGAKTRFLSNYLNIDKNSHYNAKLTSTHWAYIKLKKSSDIFSIIGQVSSDLDASYIIPKYLESKVGVPVFLPQWHPEVVRSMEKTKDSYVNNGINISNHLMNTFISTTNVLSKKRLVLDEIRYFEKLKKSYLNSRRLLKKKLLKLTCNNQHNVYFNFYKNHVKALFQYIDTGLLNVSSAHQRKLETYLTDFCCTIPKAYQLQFKNTSTNFLAQSLLLKRNMTAKELNNFKSRYFSNSLKNQQKFINISKYSDSIYCNELLIYTMATKYNLHKNTSFKLLKLCDYPFDKLIFRYDCPLSLDTFSRLSGNPFLKVSEKDHEKIYLYEFSSALNFISSKNNNVDSLSKMVERQQFSDSSMRFLLMLWTIDTIYNMFSKHSDQLALFKMGPDLSDLKHKIRPILKNDQKWKIFLDKYYLTIINQIYCKFKTHE